MPQPSRLRRLSTATLTCVSLALGGLALTPGPATAAVGDTQIAFPEVEDGVISGGPALNSGDHGNFSGNGSYTFRETGMTLDDDGHRRRPRGRTRSGSGMPQGRSSAEENVTRSMGLLDQRRSRQAG